MLLEKLVEYSRRLDLPPQLYSESPVRYIIELDANGRLLNPEPTDTADPVSPLSKRGVRRPVPQVTRAVGIKPLLLADNAEYTLGLARETSKPDRVVACHQAYMEVLQKCAQVTQESAVIAVNSFLSNNPLDQLRLSEDFDRGATMTFRVDGVMPIDLPSVQVFWAANNDPAAQNARIMQCVICGQERPVLERLQGKIKGIPGGQTAGTSIISANADAFESYGLEASYIAPTCSSCGERFTKGANDLISKEASRIVLGNAVFVFWTRRPVRFSFRSFMSDPKPEEVKALVESVRSGKVMPEVDDELFYASALSASGGRAVVRDYVNTTVGEVRRHLERWFARQEIVGSYGEPHVPLGVYALAVATVREGKDLAPTTPRALLRAAMVGTPLPVGLLYEAVKRSRAEQSVTRQRAALIKLVLMSMTDEPIREDTMVALEKNSTNTAYNCGRLLAVLERAQDLAIPGLNAGIVDRFYGTASSAPASVFGRLMRGLQPNLKTLERDKKGAYISIQQELEEIMSGMNDFPATLTLKEQGLFALGYYHQRAESRARAKERAEQGKSSQLSNQSGGDTDSDDNNEGGR